MGAWGFLAFENDDADDWIRALKKVIDLSLVELAFSRIADADGYLEAPTACEALAACEVLARLLGHPGYQNTSTKGVDEWVTRTALKPSSSLLMRAGAAIDRILAENSELRQLWEEGDAREWLNSVEDLRSRLHA